MHQLFFRSLSDLFWLGSKFECTKCNYDAHQIFVIAGGNIHPSSGSLECSWGERSCYFPSQQHCKSFPALSTWQLLEAGDLQRTACIKRFIFSTAEAQRSSWGVASYCQLAGCAAAGLLFGGLQHWGKLSAFLLSSEAALTAVAQI